MSCKYITKTCINCKHKDDYMVYFTDGTKTDLQSYKDYTDFDLQVCSNCGYISQDIETIANNNFNIINKTNEYLSILNYSYLDDYIEAENSYILDSYPANLYESYAYLNQKSYKYDDAIRAYFRCILLKEAIVRRFVKEKYDDYEDLTEQEIKSYNNIEAAINSSIVDNLQIILELYNQSTQALFIKVIYIECLLRLNKTILAEKIFNEIKNKISKEFSEFINNLIEQRR